ncbi:hypothetical protein CDD83_4962 [Cordyceps sp. RAO-2017]|nr:hypothetical protein CDD83_4962 [Cordyceps sp. RAO-2017]
MVDFVTLNIHVNTSASSFAWRMRSAAELATDRKDCGLHAANPAGSREAPYFVPCEAVKLGYLLSFQGPGVLDIKDDSGNVAAEKGTRVRSSPKSTTHETFLGELEFMGCRAVAMAGSVVDVTDTESHGLPFS